MNMYVSNLSFNTTENELQELFTEHGTVHSLKIIIDRTTGKSRGFGFVEMEVEAEANNAIKALNNKELNGRQMSVSAAREKSERPNRYSWKYLYNTLLNSAWSRVQHTSKYTVIPMPGTPVTCFILYFPEVKLKAVITNRQSTIYL